MLATDFGLAGADRLALGLGAQDGVNQTMVESHRLFGAVRQKFGVDGSRWPMA
jgi:hypothetical protein